MGMLCSAHFFLLVSAFHDSFYFCTHAAAIMFMGLLSDVLNKLTYVVWPR